MKKLITLSIILSIFSVSFSSAQSSLTIGEIFDFNVGDEFHHNRFANTWMIDFNNNKERFTVVDKYFSPNNDTVFYVRHHFGYQHWVYPSNNWYFEDHNDTVSYTHLDSIVGMMNTPWPYVFIDTIGGGYNNIQFDMNSDVYDTLWDVNSFQIAFNDGMSSWSGELGVGIGTINQGFGPEDPMDTPYGYDMTFYQKAGFLRGIIDTLEAVDVGLTEIPSSTNSNIVLFPNPTSEYLNFTWQDDAYIDIRIFETQGRLALDKSRIFKGQKVNVGDLSPGSYIIEISNSKGTFYQVLMKK